MTISVNNNVRGSAFQLDAQKILSRYLGVDLLMEQPIPIGHPPKAHRFDLASSDSKFVGECKDYHWTEGGNVPSAKISTLNEAVLYLLQLPTGTRRFAVLPRSVHPSRGETLAEYYHRTYRHLLGDIRIFELDADTNGVKKLGKKK
ncbi:hypothetical protein MYX84_03635 [Acidobacteria bacterium AH-259-O06]|nr:hypothetical protein [Acidobacteria bacterium AH-259-O06]